jgi:hypothetical protein
MRIFILLAAAIVVVAIAFGMKTTFIATPVTIATSNTLSPHEMHLGYKGMKELPVLEVKDPFWGRSRANFAEFIADETENLGKVIRAAHFKAE